VLEALAGMGYLTLLWRPLANYLSPYNLALAGPGEISLLLWLREGSEGSQVERTRIGPLSGRRLTQLLVQEHRQCCQGSGEIECQGHNERQKPSGSLLQKITV
jgi:hypothetical protein